MKDGAGSSINMSTDDFNHAYTYAGYRYDKETGLYFLNARYYAAGIGRFLTKDRVLGDDFNPKSLNRFSYAEGDPVNFIDPSGESVNALFTRAIGIGGIGAFIPVIGEVILVAVIITTVVVIGVDLIYEARKKNWDDSESDVAPGQKLQPVPDDIIERQGGEKWTAPIKKQVGKSKADLKWDPKTGEVFAQLKKGSPPQLVDKIPPRGSKTFFWDSNRERKEINSSRIRTLP